MGVVGGEVECGAARILCLLVAESRAFAGPFWRESRPRCLSASAVEAVLAEGLLGVFAAVVCACLGSRGALFLLLAAGPDSWTSGRGLGFTADSWGLGLREWVVVLAGRCCRGRLVGPASGRGVVGMAVGEALPGVTDSLVWWWGFVALLKTSAGPPWVAVVVRRLRWLATGFGTAAGGGVGMDTAAAHRGQGTSGSAAGGDFVCERLQDVQRHGCRLRSCCIVYDTPVQRDCASWPRLRQRGWAYWYPAAFTAVQRQHLSNLKCLCNP